MWGSLGQLPQELTSVNKAQAGVCDAVWGRGGTPNVGSSEALVFRSLCPERGLRAQENPDYGSLVVLYCLPSSLVTDGLQVAIYLPLICLCVAQQEAGV